MFDAASLHKRISGFYPEKKWVPENRLETLLRRCLGSLADRLKNQEGKSRSLVENVNRIGQSYGALDDTALGREIRGLKKKLRLKGATFARVCQSFALVREIAGRHLNIRHYDVQLMGGWALFNGMVAEMETGEGKTLTATLPACTAAMSGLPTHVITVNDYLAGRDASLMRPVYEAMDLSLGVIQHGMPPEERKEAYRCDVVYCTNKELVFDYLKDHLQQRQRPGQAAYPLQRLYDETVENLNLRGLYFGIVDEADSVLIDEARTPLVISGTGDSNFEEEVYRQAIDFAEQMVEDKDFNLDLTAKKVQLTDPGNERLEGLAEYSGGFWQARRRREQLVRQALTAIHIFHLDNDYIINDGKVSIVDEYTGRLMSDRSWEQGLHQMIECKEGCEITVQKDTLARMTYQRFFRRYHLLAGMTGTAREVTRELRSVYRLRVVRIPTHRPLIRKKEGAGFFISQKEKMDAIVQRTESLHGADQPVLIGSLTVENSEMLSALLDEHGLKHRILNARQDREEAEIISQAGQKGQITVATNMAGRGTDIQLGDDVEELGGLYVIGSEPHGARRIDRQLFGRCGRQGDPGSFEGFWSFEDEMFEPYLDSLSMGVVKFLLRTGTSIGLVGCRMFGSHVQRRLEKKHFVIRRELLKHDESMAKALAFSGGGE